MEARITHVGGPTVLIEVGGWRLLTDPTFEPAGARHRLRGALAAIGSRKLAGPAIPAAEIGPIDAVLLSHDHHFDNLDPAGRRLLPAAKRVLTTVSGARRLGGNAAGLAAWDSARLEAAGRPAIEVTATPCRHGPPLSRPLVGEVTGFALKVEGQRRGDLWISGDTVLCDGVREVARRVRVGTALLHLGCARFAVSGPVRYTMNAREGAELIGLLRPAVAIPIHYEGWGHFRQGRSTIEAELEDAPDEVRERVRWLPIGDPTAVEV
ncbi:MAG: MBL fold metallo-hydrolase [Solirubrobacterales bacterium]